jgi:heme exporter protein C
VTRTPKHSALFYLLCVLAAVGFAVSPYLIFYVAPEEPTMGFIQKIFYFHVPCAWAMFLGAMISGVAGALYLFSHGKRGDAAGTAAAELTVLFGVLVLITGPLWGKVAWGHYWVWDVRLTTVLLLFLIFVAVLLTRRYSGARSKKVAAALALFGAADVPLIYVSVRIWNTIHPKTTVVSELAPGMRVAFFVSLATFTALFGILMWMRFDLERSRTRLDDLMVRFEEQHGEGSPAR